MTGKGRGNQVEVGGGHGVVVGGGHERGGRVNRVGWCWSGDRVRRVGWGWDTGGCGWLAWSAMVSKAGLTKAG